MGEHRGLVTGDRPPQVEHHAKGQGIGRHLVGADETRRSRAELAKVPGHHGIQQARSPEPGQAAVPSGRLLPGLMPHTAVRLWGQALIPFR